MSFEPDTNDIRIRQLKEEIAKIREEQFARAFPTNNVGSPSIINGGSGIPAPAIGVASVIPAVIRITKDTGVIDLLNFKSKNPTQDFVIGETITGDSSGASGEVGDVDTLTDTTGIITFVPSTLSGTFTDNEFIDGSTSGNNTARADGTQFTQTGRGHLNAGAGSIIADSDKISSPFEIHFIDNAQQDGQIIYLRAQDGQTIRVRRALTTDSTTGNLDLDESFDIVENALVFFQYQVASNASDTGGWVPLITDVSATAGGGSQFQFPILYPKENLGTLNGVIDLSLNQSDGHYKQITLDGDASLTFSNLPPSINGFKFYVLTIQDGTGGHVYTDLPNSVLFENVLLGELQTDPNSQTLWQFSTADGGSNWHANVINPQGGGGGDNLGDHTATEDLDMATFNIFDLDVLRYANGIIPGSDGVIGFGVYGSAVENDTVLKWSIPRGIIGNPRFYEWQFDLVPAMQLRKDALNERWQLNLLGQGFIEDTTGISFTHQFPAPALSSITPESLELKYENGFGTGQGGFHGFHVAGAVDAQFEIREDIIRANRDLDMITNDILEIDRARFDQSGGFDSINDKDDRLISGGAEGMVLNIPKQTPFAGGFHLYFENSAETQSDKQYSFEIGQFRMFSNFVSDTLGILFSNGGSISDLNTHIQFDGGVNTNAIDPQTLKFGAKNASFTTIDMFELTGTEHNTTDAGGMKMFTDLNLQTQDLTNVDRIHFNSNNGIVGGNQTAIAGFGDDMQFNVPTVKEFSYRVNDEEVAQITQGTFRMLSNSFVTNPSIISDGSFILGLTSPSSPFIDGEFRLVDNSGSLDVEVFTGGGVVNLTTGGSGTSFIGFNADDDLRMNTFDINEVDVLRFQPDGASIGASDYAITAGSADAELIFNVPLNRNYVFENALDPIAVIDQTGMQLLSNPQFFNPQLGAREFSLSGQFIGGTTGQDDGKFRLVADDVIIGSGGGLVNLTLLGAGGGDNLGDHTATQPLNMQNNAITNFIGWTSGIGESFIVNPTNFSWDLPATNFYQWKFGGVPHMELSISDLNVGNKQITNVLDPLNNLDAVNLQTLNTGLSTVDVSQWANFPAVNNVNVAGFQLTNTIAINGIGNGGGLIWGAPNFGQFITGDTAGIDLSTASPFGTVELKFGGTSKHFFSSAVALFDTPLSMANNRITTIADPIGLQDAVNLQFLQGFGGGGDASQWSLFPALQQVNMAQNALNNVTAVAFELGGGLIWDFPSGAFIFADAVGLNLTTFSSQQVDIRFGGLARATFTNTGHSFDGGNLDMNFNKIVNVNSPSFAFEVANKLYVDSVAGTPGGSLLTNPLNIWTGTQVYTGNQHSILTSQMLIGGDINDDIFFLGRVESDFDPSSSGTQIMGGFGLPWDQLHVSEIFMSGVNFSGSIPPNGGIDMNFGRIVFCDDPINAQDVATKFYVDNTAGGGSALLTSNNFWTGINTFAGTSHNVISGFQLFGDTFGDDINIVARFDFPLIPKFSNDNDLGAPSNRWRTLYADFVNINDLFVLQDSIFQGNVFMGGGGVVSVSGGGSLSVSGGGNLVVTSPSNLVVTGGTFPQGTFFHSGSQLGFFGAGLDTRNTVNDVVATGDAFTNTLLLTGAHNQLLFALEDYGLINVV